MQFLWGILSRKAAAGWYIMSKEKIGWNEFKRVEIPKNNKDVNINNKTNTEKITVEKNNDTIENIYSNESGPTFFI